MEGKQLEPRTPQEEREHQQRENLYTAIAKLTAIGREFEKPEYWEDGQTRKTAQAAGESRYYSFDELFARQSKGHQHGTFATFAGRKADELEQSLKEVRELASRDYYRGHPVYELAEKYISYLLSVKDEVGKPATTTTGSPNKPAKKRPGCPAANKPFAAYFSSASSREKVLAVLKQHHASGEVAPAARIIKAAQNIGYFPNNVKAAPVHRALSEILQGLGGVRAFTGALKESDPNEIKRYEAEIKNAQTATN